MILIVAANFPPEPVLSASLSKELADTLSGRMKVRVITPEPSRPMGFSFTKSYNSDCQYEHVVLNSYTYAKSRITGRFFESYSFGKHAARHINENKEIIKCCYVSAWPLIAQFLIIKTLKKYSILSVIHIQDIYPESLTNKIQLFSKILQKLILPLDKYILSNSTKIIAISGNMKNTFIRTRGISKDKIVIIQNWQDETKFLHVDEFRVSTLKKRIIPGHFVFMYLGNIGPVAGVDLLIRSFNKAAISSSTLIIAGSGSEKENCIRLARSLNSSGIEFWDAPDGDVPSMQHVADIMLLPVKKGAAMSSIPSKLLAYMFSSKPIIACLDAGSDTAEAIGKAGCGWIVPPEDVDLLADMMIIAVSTTIEERRQFGENGYRYARENFSSGKNVGRLISVIMDTMDR